MKKWQYDFLLSTGIMIFVLVALFYSYILDSPRITVFLARPDTYMAMWLIIFAFLAILLMARALKIKETEEGQKRLPSIWQSMPIITAVILFVYLLILKKIGFLIDSILMLWSLSYIYTIDSQKKENGKYRKKICLFVVIKTGVFAVICSGAIYYVFTKILSSKLPVFTLF